MLADDDTAPGETAAEEPRKGYTIEVYQRPDGWWSFRINGRESLYRSSNEYGLDRTIRWLLNGRPPGAIQLQPVRAEATQPTPGKKGRPPARVQPHEAAPVVGHWADLPTARERVEAFMRRGKLAPRLDDDED